jgi:hypothetical protein
MITGYTYEDNEKSGSKKIYGMNGVGYASMLLVPYLSKKSQSFFVWIANAI